MGYGDLAIPDGQTASVHYLQALGMDQVREHEAQITGYALDAFKELEDVDVFGPPDPAKRGGVIPFHTSEVHAHDFGTVLDRRGIAVRTGHHCTMPLMGTLGVAATVRASFYIYNTEEEVDMLVDAVREAMRYFLDGSG